MGERWTFFFDDALVEADEAVLERLGQLPHLTFAIRQAKIKKAHYLGADVEKNFDQPGWSLLRTTRHLYQDAGWRLWNGWFEVDGKVYKNSFVTYENFYQNHENAEVREKAFRSFSEGLRKHQNTAAATYLAQVKSEKLIADMRGYDSVFDYLLAEQEVDRAMLTSDWLIMKDFAPVAQKFLKHVAKVNGLEKMTFADWKLDLDSALNPDVTIDDAYDLVMNL